MQDVANIRCPYCGEAITVLVDASAGSQRYIEDCQVCCRPIAITVEVDGEGRAQVRGAAEDEA